MNFWDCDDWVDIKIINMKGEGMNVLDKRVWEKVSIVRVEIVGEYSWKWS